MEGERREEQRLRIIFGVELATDEDRELFGHCSGVCFDYSIAPYEIIKVKYIVSHIIVVASQIGEWDGPTSYSVPLLNGPYC